jgi:predicted metal-dependent hydrolase
VFPSRLTAMLPPFERRGLKRPHLIIRRMTKRWGSFTPAGNITLNVDLVRASFDLIDYVICHELAHAFYSDHSDKWQSLLSSVLPDWEERKLRLETTLR